MFNCKDITMNLENYLQEETSLDEGILHKYNISLKASKLIKVLEIRRNELEFEIKKEKNLDKLKDKKEIVRAINKSIPVINDFKKYFQRLERRIEKLPESEKRKEIELKYEEIRMFFLNELYHIMYSVGYKASTVIASAIFSLILAIVFIPGGGPLLFLPTVQLIRKINIARNKITSGALVRELDRITRELQIKKRMSFNQSFN